jgi:8-oxo-dGDP phosphatase
VAAGVGEFRLLSSETIHEGFVFRLASELYEAPNGEQFRREIVRHGGAVGVVALHEDRTVTVVSQFRASVNQRLLEIPAGLLDKPGEPLDEAARRELREETGLVCDRLDHLCTYLSAAGMTDERITIFLARGLTQVDDERQGPEEEDIVVSRLPLGRVLDMIADGSLVDGKTAFALSLLLAQGA